MQPTREWVNQVPLKTKAEMIGQLSGLSQFHGMPDETLIGLARQRTRVQVSDRWGAIRMLISNPCPIPVVDNGQNPPRRPLRLPAPPPRLTLIRGGRIVR